MKLFSARFIIPLFLLTLIVSFFLLTRSAEHISRNFVFVLDQGRDYVFVRDMILNRKPTLIGSEIGGGYAGFQGIFQGPIHFYLLSFFFLIFSGDPYGGVVYMGIFAALAVLTAYFLGKNVFGTFYGLLMALLITLSPPLISSAKFAWNPHPVIFFIILSFLFIYLSQSKSIKFIFLAGFFSAFTYNFEIATTIPLLIALVLFCMFVLKLRKIKEYLSLFLGIGLGLAPLILFEIRHNFIAINGFLKYLTSFGSNAKSGYGLINNHIPRFAYNFWDSFPHQDMFPEALILFIFLISFVVLFINEKRTELRRFIIFLLILIVSTIFVFSFLRNTVFIYYIYQLCVAYVFLFIYVLYASVVQKRFDIKVLFFPLLVIYIFFAFKDGLRDFKNDLSDKFVYQKINGKIQAVDYIYKDAGFKQFGLFIFAPAVYTYPYDYLFWWRGKKYNSKPNQDKTGLFYLLIEKDESKPWTYKGWLETVVREGRIIETKILPSGLIIEKRCGPNCPID